MEDASAAIGSLSGGQGAWADTGFFGVFDGHGSAQVAQFCADNLPKHVTRGQPSQAPQALKEAFVAVDRMIGEAAKNMPPNTPGHPVNCGSTAVVCLISPDVISVANIGDSRAVLSRNGRAHELSQDHKPSNWEETDRISRAGGRVTEQRIGNRTISRINGDLACSRAMGDFRFKNNARLSPEDQMVSCVPDITSSKRQPADEFVVVACDGIWDVLSSQEVVDQVGRDLAAIRRGDLQPSDVVSRIVDGCLATDPAQSHGLGADNMSMILVIFEGRADKLNTSYANGSWSFAPESRIENLSPTHPSGSSRWPDSHDSLNTSYASVPRRSAAHSPVDHLSTSYTRVPRGYSPESPVFASTPLKAGSLSFAHSSHSPSPSPQKVMRPASVRRDPVLLGSNRNLNTKFALA